FPTCWRRRPNSDLTFFNDLALMGSASPGRATRTPARCHGESSSRGSGASGTLTAPFSGIHGWYWENLGNQEITVTLTSSGFYNMSHEFRSGSPVKNKMFR